MSLFVGLDVSQRLTHICVVDVDGKRVWRGKCTTDPTILAQTICAQAGPDARVGVETGPSDAVACSCAAPAVETSPSLWSKR